MSETIPDISCLSSPKLAKVLLPPLQEKDNALSSIPAITPQFELFCSHCCKDPFIYHAARFTPKPQSGRKFWSVQLHGWCNFKLRSALQLPTVSSLPVATLQSHCSFRKPPMLSHLVTLFSVRANYFRQFRARHYRLLKQIDQGPPVFKAPEQSSSFFPNPRLSHTFLRDCFTWTASLLFWFPLSTVEKWYPIENDPNGKEQAVAWTLLEQSGSYRVTQEAQVKLLSL